MNDHTQKLLDFLNNSPTPYHCVKNVIQALQTAGFQYLDLSDQWQDLAYGKYYLTRNDSSIVAFKYVEEASSVGFRLVGAHTDSPCLKIKPNPVTVNNGYAKFALAVYGGALLNPWFDRDLALAGRVTYLDASGFQRNVLINVNQAISFIPSLAIHLDREANEKRSINKQSHLPAVMARCDSDKYDFYAQLKEWVEAENPDLKIDKIIGDELSLYDHQPAALVGIDKEFVVSARLDNLLSCFAAYQALIASNNHHNQLIVLNDHEEVGSGSSSGAQGPFLQTVLSRICKTQENYSRCVEHSMMISADNAHGVHPNYVDAHEPAHQPLINNGPVIKINHNQRYATNSESEGLFKSVCQHLNVPCQIMVVRSDMSCGSTIGPITATKIGCRTVDVGVPQLAMHSIREMAGTQDQAYLVEALKGFYEYEKWPF